MYVTMPRHSLARKLCILLILLVQIGTCAAENLSVPTVAVWDFDNNTPNPEEAAGLDYLKRVLPEVLLSNFSGRSSLRTIERIALKDVLDEQKLGSSDLADEDTRLKLGKLIGARYMIFGDIMASGISLRVDMRLVDVETSQVLISRPYVGVVEKVVADTEVFAAQVLANLEPSGASPAPQGNAQVESTVFKEYDRGLALMDSRQFPDAILVFKSLLAAHPGFAPAEKQIAVALERLSRQ